MRSLEGKSLLQKSLKNWDHNTRYKDDAFNLCVFAKEDQLRQLNVTMLKQILCHFEIPFKSRERKGEP